MIEVSDLIRKIRYKLNDFNETKYSDYDILMALNEVIDYLALNKTLRNSDFLEREINYNQDNFPDVDFFSDGITLPYDFVTLVSVNRATDGYSMHPVNAGYNMNSYDGNYKIVNNKLYTKEVDINITYRFKVEQAESADDDITLPEMFTNVLVNATVTNLGNGNPPFQQVIDDTVESIVPRRRYTHTRTKMPFYC